MTESTKLSYFGTVPGTGNYTTIFVDVSIFQQLGYTLFCSANGTLDINWSMDGINTDLTETATFTAGNTITGSVRRHTKFVQLDVTSTNGAQLRFQTHLNANSPGIHALDNTGTGAQIYDKSGGKIRSLLSSDTSITITEAVDHIDLVSAGGGSNWELSGSTILKQINNATVNNLFFQTSDNGHVFDTTFNPVNNIVLGGNYNYFDGDEGNVLIGGFSSEIYRYGNIGGGYCRNNYSFGVDNGTIQASSHIARSRLEDCCSVGAGEILSNGNGWIERCRTFGSSDGVIYTASVATSAIIRNTSIFGGIGNWCSINNDTKQIDSCSIFGGMYNTISDTCENSNIFAGRNFTINNLSGCVMIGDNSLNTLSASVNDQYTSRFAGGYRVYSNATATTGMTMSAGGSSWVAVCDRNKKDIHGEVNYDEYLEKLDNIPVYEYNYKGNCKEQRCIGPMAQDYHAYFGCDKIECEIIENIQVGEEVLTFGKDKKERKVPKYEQVIKKEMRCAKDPLGIEQQDFLGILMACVKALNQKVKEQEERIKDLESKII